MKWLRPRISSCVAVSVVVRGSVLRARILAFRPPGSHGGSGVVAWFMQDIVATNGDRIPVNFAVKQPGNDRTRNFEGYPYFLSGYHKDNPAIKARRSAFPRSRSRRHSAKCSSSANGSSAVAETESSIGRPGLRSIGRRAGGGAFAATGRCQRSQTLEIHRHSYRSATSGSTRMARRAGM